MGAVSDGGLKVLLWEVATGRTRAAGGFQVRGGNPGV